MAITFARTTNSNQGAQMGMSASIAFPNITASGSTFTIPTITGTMTSYTYNSSTYIQTQAQNSSYFSASAYIDGTSVTSLYFSYGYLDIGSSSGWASKSWSANSTGTTKNTSLFFNSSNPSTKTLPITLKNPSWNISTYYGNFSNSNSTTGTGTATLTLDVPPTATVSSISYDTGYIYSGLTTASVTVSSSTAYYGGTISSVEFTIGSQTDTLSGDGTLSIALANPGTFTPTVSITDSRGQTKTYALDPITVNTYTAPTVSFDVDRTDSNGTPDDEGTYGLIEATLTFSDVVATAVAPSVVLTDENGTQTTPTVTWYTDNTLQTTVTWANVSSGNTVYGLFSGLNTNYSYSVSVRPRDDQGTGTAITQTISSAFYTIDFLAGGHGIAFGQPASQQGFYCNMDAHFVDAASTMRALFDFIYPVGSYYETSDTTFNPNTTWGGTWVLETEGQVHVSAGTNYNVAGALTNTSDGGSSTVTLNANQIPYHTHDIWYDYWTVTNNSGTARQCLNIQAGASTYKKTTNAQSGSYGGAHNNMQPYIIVNRWHRTA